MAYFRKRGSTWYYTVDVGKDPLTGERKQKSKGGFRTKKEAQLAAQAIEQESAFGTYIEEKNITFEDFAKQWIELYQNSGKVKISTVRVRQHELNNLLPYFAKLKMNTITKKKYQDAINDLKNKFSDNTLKGINSTGKMIFKKAVQLDVIKTDPTTYAYVPTTQKTVEDLENEEEAVKYLEKEELALFLNTAREKGLYQDYIVFILLSYTGMRAGELCALKWKDIDFNEHTISIKKTYYNPTNNATKYQLLTPKTETSKRVIEIDEGVVAELEKHKRAQKELMMKYRLNYYDGDFVITKINKHPGFPEIIKVIENRMKRLLKLANLNTELTPHSLRHTHTSLLAEAGVQLHEIMERLGHRDDTITRKVYLHVTKTKKKEASQKFAQLMRSL